MIDLNRATLAMGFKRGLWHVRINQFIPLNLSKVFLKRKGLKQNSQISHQI